MTSFNEEDREKLRTIITKDVEFLRKHALMDYSLLLAIERGPKAGESPTDPIERPRSTRMLKDGEEVIDYVEELISRAHCYRAKSKIYHIAIIDYLQGWTLQKKGERCSKMTFLGKDGDRLSAIEP